MALNSDWLNALGGLLSLAGWRTQRRLQHVDDRLKVAEHVDNLSIHVSRMAQAHMQQVIASQLGSSPPAGPRYRTTTITIRETSNGQIVQVGEILRLCTRDDRLVDVIGAALAEHELAGDGR